ncbi:MAG: hypothetical protein U0Y10_16620 [Spirosomataceae bacterium]
MGKTIALPTSQGSAVSSSFLLDIPVYVYATIIASCCIIIGIYWDISWHKSIGRDGLLSPPHVVVYVGAALAGLFSGYQVLKTSFWGSTTEQSGMVHFWGIFYSSLGALFCIWGSIACLTSAPFDDWWHNTYGLDVRIFSPPHTLLALGMMSIQIGAMMASLALQNRGSVMTHLSIELNERRTKRLQFFFLLTASLWLTLVCVFLSEFLADYKSHAPIYYQVAAGVFPLIFLAVGKASPVKWSLTIVSLVYMGLVLAENWILQLFPAEPLLGPVLFKLTHYQPLDFPLMLIIPAVAFDVLRTRIQDKNQWLQAVLYSLLFLLVFLPIQWNLGAFILESPLARNWFFGGDSWYFGAEPDWEYRHKFAPWNVTTWPQLAQGLLIAFVIGTLSARLGLRWGQWMKKIQR